MSSKKFRNSRIIIFEANRSKTPLKLSSNRKPVRTPSPESAILVKSKVDLFTSFKDSFQRTKSRSKFLNPLPKSTIQVPKLDIQNLNINNYGLGDSRAQLLSKTIKSIERLQSLNMKGNGMKEKGVSSILHSINKENIKIIDLSSNSLGNSAMVSLCEILTSFRCCLEELNLENTKISLAGLTDVCTALKSNKTLKKLNLANNAIGLGSGALLADMLDYNNSIEILDLQWNFIRGPDIIVLTQAIKNNNRLQTLDLSWNSMGHDRIHESALKLFKNLFTSESLIHLDLSNNNFSVNDTEIIAGLLKNNQKIRGLHFDGNYGIIDALGFLNPLPFLMGDKNIRKKIRICAGLGRCYENCWICNDWKDFFIEWDPYRVVWNRRLQHFALNKLNQQEEPVYIHLEVDDFKPFLLRSTDGVYSGVRALPKGKNRFFFTYRGVAQISNEYPFEVSEPPVKQTCHFYADFNKEVMAVVVNFIINDGKECNAVPRPVLGEYLPPPGDIPEPEIPPWTPESSIFSNFSQQGPDFFNRCFEADWTNSKISKFLKNEQIRNDCKEIIRQEYQKIYFTYKFLAGLSGNNTLFSVSLNNLTDLYQRKGIFDKFFKLSDLDLNIKACTTSSTSTHFNNNFSVVRHEFLELQIRLAFDKFLRNGASKSEAEALSVFFTSNVFMNVLPNEWRVNRLFNEECDLVLTANKELLNAVYESSKGKVSKNSEKRGLCEEDFMFVMQEHGFFNERFTSRYGHICFHLALTTRVDEISSNVFMLANFFEFIEAFCRVCDMTDSLDVDKDILIGFCNPEVTLDKKIELGLSSFNYLKGRRGRR